MEMAVGTAISLEIHECPVAITPYDMDGRAEGDERVYSKLESWSLSESQSHARDHAVGFA